MSGPNPRVAPTAKISDDATFPTPAGHPAGPASIPPQHIQSVPPSMPAPRQTPQSSYQYTPGPASIPPQHSPAYTPGPASIPPQHSPVYTPGPASIPPQNHGTFPSAPGSVPPQNNSVPPQASPYYTPGAPPPGSVGPPVQLPSGPHATGPVQPRTTAPQRSISAKRTSSRASSPSVSSSEPVVPQRRWGLIITVLLIDLALAGTGVYLLSEGLS